jgi:hypothetical protein
MRLGLVRPGPAVTIADGATASPGDLIICTRNDHTVDADPATGQRRWTDRHFLFNSYQDAELGYAVTDHVAQGRTVTAGQAAITGAEDRPHALVALTRGTTNLAYVFTQSPKRADPVSGPRPNWPGTTTKRAERSGVPAPPISSATPAREQRYKDLVAASLPPGYHRPLSHQAKWLWWTLRAAQRRGQPEEAAR